MSRHINVNPDHYKVAGRERQGGDVVHQMEKREVARLRQQEGRIPGPHADGGAMPGDRTAATASPESTGPPLTSVGISNRQPPEADARERDAHPPIDTSSPPPEDAAGRVGEQPLDDYSGRQTSHKAGSRSIAQKEAGVRYPDRSAPASRKVDGAFGREPRSGSASEPSTTGSAKRSRNR